VLCLLNERKTISGVTRGLSQGRNLAEGAH